ncbi:MAG: chemotaxis protein CheD [Verrucomicrobiota bacterium]|jgi:chemotaxis protein CheD
MRTSCLKDVAGFDKRLVVGVGALEVSNNPGAILTTYSLGSCLGVTIYDPLARAGGLLHTMLPDSTINAAKAAERPAMFMDTGLAALFRAAYELGAEKHRVHICVAGGSQFMDDSGLFNIGQRNYKMFTDILRQHGLVIAARAVGGYVSRTMQLQIGTGEVRLKTSGQHSETILHRS